MENTYLGILRGKMLPVEISAQLLLKGAEDHIFYLETKQISGYTTQKTIFNTLSKAIEQEADSEQLQKLLHELRNMRISSDFSMAAEDVTEGQPLLSWIGIE